MNARIVLVLVVVLCLISGALSISGPKGNKVGAAPKKKPTTTPQPTTTKKPPKPPKTPKTTSTGVSGGGGGGGGGGNTPKTNNLNSLLWPGQLPCAKTPKTLCYNNNAQETSSQCTCCVPDHPNVPALKVNGNTIEVTVTMKNVDGTLQNVGSCAPKFAAQYKTKCCGDMPGAPAWFGVYLYLSTSTASAWVPVTQVSGHCIPTSDTDPTCKATIGNVAPGKYFACAVAFPVPFPSTIYPSNPVCYHMPAHGECIPNYLKMTDKPCPISVAHVVDVV